MVNVGVIGCGYWGSLLARKVSARKYFKLVGIADAIEGNLSNLKQQIGETATYTDFKELIKNSECNAVILATPITTHFELAKYCLSENKHVLVEKPLAMAEVQCNELIALAKEKQKTLMVDHTFLYVPAINALGEHLKSSQFGQCQTIDIVQTDFGGFCRDVDVLWDIAPHTLAVLLNFFGKPEKVSSSLSRQTSAIPSHTGYISMEFTNGPQVHLRFSWNGWERKREWVFTSEKQMLLYDDLKSPENKMSVKNRSVKYESGKFIYMDGEAVTQVLPTPTQDPLSYMLEDFNRCIETGKAPVSNAVLGREVVKLLEELHRNTTK